jgi:hypothetical protein
MKMKRTARKVTKIATRTATKVEIALQLSWHWLPLVAIVTHRGEDLESYSPIMIFLTRLTDASVDVDLTAALKDLPVAAVA